MIGLVLAAGRGERMGQPKATLEVNGKTAAWRSAELLLEAGIKRVVVAVREPLDLPDGAECYVVPRPDGEAIDTIRQARRHIGPGAIALLPVDCQAVRVDTVRQLIQAYKPPFIKPTHQGRGGHPVLFDISLIGVKTLREALGEYRGICLEVDDPGVLSNWNTPEEARSEP